MYKGLPLQPMICAVQHPIKLTGIKVNDHASKGGIPSGNVFQCTNETNTIYRL